MWQKIVKNWHDGTLLAATKRKTLATLRIKRRPMVIGDCYYGETATSYLAKRLAQPIWHAEQEVTRDMLSRLPNGISVLDVPFGTGRFVPYYLEKGMSIFGLDASSEMLLVAKQTLGDDYLLCDLRVGDARSLPYGDDSFDLVVSFRFLQTQIKTTETPKVLRELQRVTRSHAILELKVRNDDVLRPRRSGREPMTAQLCEQEIHKLLGKTGFAVRHVEIIGPYRDVGRKCAYLCEKMR